MQVLDTKIGDLKVIVRNEHEDNRGKFSRLFCQDELQSYINDKEIVQINLSTSYKVGTVRGLHFQYPPNSETKIIQCLRGKVWDVAVDIRKGSKTYLHWHAEELDSGSNKTLLIPDGFAHGFQVLQENSQLLYFHTAKYSKKDEDGLHISDPELNISWPLRVTEISEKDMSYKMINKQFTGISL